MPPPHARIASQGSFFCEVEQVTKGPNVKVFERFANSWNEIHKTRFKSGIIDPNVKKHMNKVIIDAIKKFCSDELNVNQPRDDYKELLELTILFVGGNVSTGYKYAPPGAAHHARWMTKAIYLLKIYMFRDKFNLAKRDLDGIRDVCVFLAILYVEHWF